MICPKCKKKFEGRPALSRDNKTQICSECGYREAIESFESDKEKAEEILKEMLENEKRLI